MQAGERVFRETDRCVKVALRLGYVCVQAVVRVWKPKRIYLWHRALAPGMGAPDHLWCSCRSRQRELVSMPCASGSAGTYHTTTIRRSIFQVWISRLPLSYTLRSASFKYMQGSPATSLTPEGEASGFPRSGLNNADDGVGLLWPLRCTRLHYLHSEVSSL